MSTIREYLLKNVKTKERTGLAIVTNGDDRYCNHLTINEGGFVVKASNNTPMFRRGSVTPEEMAAMELLSVEELIDYGKEFPEKVRILGDNGDGVVIYWANEFYKELDLGREIDRINNIHIVSEESFGNIMKATHLSLNYRVPKEVWSKIKHCFTYTNTYEINDEMYYGGFNGYEILEDKVEELENLLEIPVHLQHQSLLDAAEKDRKEKARIAKEKKDLIIELNRVFSEENQIDIEAEKKELLENNKRMVLHGDRIYISSSNLIYGGGSWFTIEEDSIFKVINNGSDGDWWGVNFIATGGAGAYGYKFPKTEEGINLLMKLKEYNL